MSATDTLDADPLPVGSDSDFKQELLGLIPAMRAFARSLCRDRDEADDLAQDALFRALQAWRSYRPGTNLKAWVFTILRNRFYSLRRVAGRETALDPEIADRIPDLQGDPLARFELDAVRHGLRRLPDEQRETIMMICAAGLTYEEAAAIADCPVGTIKSRLSRGRATLAAVLEAGGATPIDDLAPSRALPEIMAEALALAGPRTRTRP